ncbi:hypothetical protein [Aphanothece hegewaldii]|uniref:hypothetical protein n=1 Tax=Aphanothece hegewaldii TaxID=1521625 RepID=UPI001FE509F5|nr:hypothetical protein [Aphanothece hegewaldii]
MALFPNDSNGDSASNFPQKTPEDFGIETARTKAVKRQALNVFAILVAIGLVLGAIMSIGVVKLINKLGLTEKPDRNAPIELFRK